MSIHSETETVIKKILPYLERRGYDINNDFEFETALNMPDGHSKGFIDILVTLGKKSPSFLIEAKRISKKLTAKDRDQAIRYAKAPGIDVPLVVVTNGIDMYSYNVHNSEKIMWRGKKRGKQPPELLCDKIPSRDQIKQVIARLRTNPNDTVIDLSGDESLPYRRSLPLRQLNALFYKGHSTIRKIEKDEESAFSDFSKLLFLRLLEERSDLEDKFVLPYSYKFYQLAALPVDKADQVKDAIISMIRQITEDTSYGEVLQEPIRIQNPRTYLSLVKDLASVSFSDCSVDSKGAAFEYYVRATLKGKKLGQYFTPRELVQVMSVIIGQNKVLNALLSSTPIKVLDPACGTGGFIVYLMKDTIHKLDLLLKSGEITNATYEKALTTLKTSVFYGSDANKGVAAAAKMNLIIAGDGHSNIRHEDSLSNSAKNWSTTAPDCDIIITNPPFGTAEGDSLLEGDMKQFDVSSTKGQYLFLQKMIGSTVDRGTICSVIDEGVLNTDSGSELRKYILQQCKVRAIISLPPETFKPNKINVRSSVLLLEKRKYPDIDLEDSYRITICKLNSLGYEGSGDKIRGFDSARFLNELSSDMLNTDLGDIRGGYNWESFDIDSTLVSRDATHRFDFKYWEVGARKILDNLAVANLPTISCLNTIETSRGKSPTTDCYVDEADGYALVVKADSSISKFGQLLAANSDWIEKSVYDEFAEKATELECNLNIIQYGDVLLASTGTGTLGKCCVYNLKDTPAIADGHVTIIRVNKDIIDPYYLADYLRIGFGATQIEMLYTGSTGLIELTPDQVDKIIVDTRLSLTEQRALSQKVRELEDKYQDKMAEADLLLAEAKAIYKVAN